MSKKFSQDLVDSWKDGNAVFVEYRISHSYLRIAITSDSKDGCLDIQCLDTEYICGKTRWANCDLKIETLKYKTEFGIPICYVIKDENAGFEICCGAISASELDSFNDLIQNV
jgi:hypothetical protein